MALIKCNECSREISDRASSCPGCGAPISVSNPPAQEVVKERNELKKNVALIALLVLAVASFAYYQHDRNKRKELAADFGVSLETYDGYGEAWKGVVCKLKAQKELQDYGAASAADYYQRCLKRHGVNED